MTALNPLNFPFGISTLQQGPLDENIAENSGGEEGGTTLLEHAAEVGVGKHIPNDGIRTQDIASSAIESEQIADGAIQNRHYDPSAATSPVVITHIAEKGLGTHIPDAGITATEIAANAITGVKILNGTITTDKMAPGALNPPNGSVSTLQIVNGAIISTKLADGAVVSSKIVNGAVGTNQVANGGITASKLAANSVSGNILVDDGILGSKIVDGAIVSAKLADNSVLTAKILNAAVTNAKIADNSITTNKIPNAAVTQVKLAPDSVGATQIQPNAVGQTELADNSVDTASIINNAITWTKLQTPQWRKQQDFNTTMSSGSTGFSLAFTFTFPVVAETSGWLIIVTYEYACAKNDVIVAHQLRRGDGAGAIIADEVQDKIEEKEEDGYYKVRTLMSFDTTIAANAAASVRLFHRTTDANEDVFTRNPRALMIRIP